jgi:hypothetical protein
MAISKYALQSGKVSNSKAKYSSCPESSLVIHKNINFARKIIIIQ